MAKQQYSAYQKKIVSSYYDNLDTIMLGRLQELVTELYLVESAAKQDQLWVRAEKAMVKLKIKPAIIRHLLDKRDVTILAKNVADWLRPRGK